MFFLVLEKLGAKDSASKAADSAAADTSSDAALQPQAPQTPGGQPNE
jgi:hypothetical protein